MYMYMYIYVYMYMYIYIRTSTLHSSGTIDPPTIRSTTHGILVFWCTCSKVSEYVAD